MTQKFKLLGFLILTMTEYTIDGRKITISYEVNLERNLIKILEKEILLFCEAEKIVKQFPHLVFIVCNLNPKKLDLIATVSPELAIKGEYVVRLNAPALNAFFVDAPQEIRKLLKLTLTHELTHLWQFSLVPAYTASAKSAKRLLAKIEADQKVLGKNKASIQHLRYFLQEFFHSLCLEGIAVYCSFGEKEGLPFSEEMFVKTYEHARSKADLLSGELIRMYANLTGKEGVFEKRIISFVNSFIIQIEPFKYDVGLHLVYSIMFLGENMTVEKVIKLKPLEAIKVYEELMITKGAQLINTTWRYVTFKKRSKPLVSLNSGRGILDYNKMLVEWSVLFKSVK